MTYLDTHVLIWLYQGEASRLGLAARNAIAQDDLAASPMAVLELQLLHEIGRLKPSATKVIEALMADISLSICDLPFRTVAEHAIREKWVRDPFDRLIVANARAADAPLVSKDERIRRHYGRTIW